MRNLLIAGLGLCSCLISACLAAQNLNSEDIRSQFIKDWERAKAYTIDYLNNMPANKYSLKRQIVFAALLSKCCTWHRAM
jgi:hypothetical protein